MLEIEALQLALSKEEAAIELYNELAVKHSGLKDLFYAMVTEEQKHNKWIEKKIVEMTCSCRFNSEHFSPVQL